MNAILHNLILSVLVGAILFASPPGFTRDPKPADGAVTDTYGGRSMIVYVPPGMPISGTRALVVVLHGGLGNAQHIEKQDAERGLNLNEVAKQGGFVVAYLNGTPATRLLGSDKLAWNAGGGCCGRAAQTDVDDVGYIKGAVDYLAQKYGIDPARIFGTGHSNGAMMTQRVMCETGLYAAAVTFSGPLTLDITACPAASGKRILAIHGAADRNVPLAGGRGTKGISSVAFKSEDSAKQIFTASDATYDLEVLKGADHFLDHIEIVLHQIDGVTIPEKTAQFFGLLNQTH